MSSGASVKLDKDKDDRRGADRFPIEREVRYKILNRKNVDEVGIGKTINMSSNGVLFTHGTAICCPAGVWRSPSVGRPN